MWSTAQLVFGLMIVAFGLIINLARHHGGVKNFIEKYVLGTGELLDPNAPYAPAVNFAGWKSFITGLGVAVPLPIWWDNLLLGLAVLVLAWIVLRVKREYAEARKVVDGEPTSA